MLEAVRITWALFDEVLHPHLLSGGLGGRDSGRYPGWWARSGCLACAFSECARAQDAPDLAPLYRRGLLGLGERKSLQPMAARLGLSRHDQLQHFIASPAWDDGPLWTELAHTGDRLVGGPDAYLVIDDTVLPKKGELSVGVARQYCGPLGKRANCQALVSLTLAQGEVPVPSACGCSCRRPGPMIPNAALERACLRRGSLPAARARSRWPSWIVCARPGGGSGLFWPTRATVPVPRSGGGWTRAGCRGRLAFHATRRFTAAACSLSRRPGASAVPCQTRSRGWPRGSWPGGGGGA
ncbi:protein of unknown function [Rhodovastum atsumiense]|nr:protein of unknown function [Rhodovastum atsumiense]